MVEGTCLENKRAGNGTVGSNPTPSAKAHERPACFLAQPETPQVFSFLAVLHWLSRSFTVIIPTAQSLVTARLARKEIEHTVFYLLAGSNPRVLALADTKRGVRWYKLMRRSSLQASAQWQRCHPPPSYTTHSTWFCYMQRSVSAAFVVCHNSSYARHCLYQNY